MVQLEAINDKLPSVKKCIILYHVYINSKKRVAEGHHISIDKACESPTCQEIGDCCKHLGLNCMIELDKGYPRDFMQSGRVRVMLKKEDGVLSNSAISPRKQLMLRVAETSTPLKSRKAGSSISLYKHTC